VEGRPANVAAACLDGKLLGAVQAEVIRSNGAFGPSTVIRVIDHPEMLAAATQLVAKLRLTGLCGLDFVLDEKTGRAELIELNPRATPTAHLLSVDGVDLLTSLRLALGRPGPPARTCTYPDGLVALFPLEMQRDPTSPFLTTAFHDVPVERTDLAPENSHRNPSVSLLSAFL
jgi:biotin carboxylase